MLSGSADTDEQCETQMHWRLCQLRLITKKNGTPKWQTWEAGRGSDRSIGMGQFQPFRLSPIDVVRVVKKLAQRAGLDPANYSGRQNAAS
jgi:hypothetical protein